MSEKPKITAYLSLGSNMEDRMRYIKGAGKLLSDHSELEIVKASKVYETEPWPLHEVPNSRKGHPHKEGGQDWFLNQVIKVETSLLPLELLALLDGIEAKLGREHKQHWGDREIDLDILLYNEEVIELPELEVPHRHMMDRQFILIPLLEIEPQIKDPVSGRSYQEFLDEIKDDHKVTPYL